MDASELSQFARRHNIAFLACGGVVDEMHQLCNLEQILPGRDIRAIAEYRELTFA
jgi:hypothetical protein